MKSFLILFLSSGILYCQSVKSETSDFSKADSIASSYPEESIHNLPKLVYNLTASLDSESEKFRAIYYWVCSNIKNDYNSFKKTVTKRKKYGEHESKFLKWSTNYLPKVFKRLVNQRKASCTGYAYLIEQMATLAGLECQIVNGFAKTANTNLTLNSSPNHSWNAIKLDGKWYLCDATWSAGRVNLENHNPKFVFDFSKEYFMAPPELFSKNHYPLEHKWLLMQKPYSFNEFLEGPLVYKGAFENEITPVQPNQMFLNVQPKETVEFEFSIDDDKKVDFLELIIIKGESKTRIRPENLKTDNGLKLCHSFARNGIYDIHIMVNEAVIATFVIDVAKNSSCP